MLGLSGAGVHCASIAIQMQADSSRKGSNVDGLLGMGACACEPIFHFIRTPTLFSTYFFS